LFPRSVPDGRFNSVSKFDDLIDYLLWEGLDDWTMMVSIVRMAEAEHPDEGRAAARQLVHELIEGGWMVPGELVGEGLEPWSSSPADSVRRILDDLDTHDWDVMDHSLFWFKNTPAGDERARG